MPLSQSVVTGACTLALRGDAADHTAMQSTKTLAVIGASEETVAHLRLLMKLGAKQLRNEWRWGEEGGADFVAVEVHDLGCQGVLARCQAAGVPCALMAEANEVVVHGLVLRRPFKLDQIVAVLNAAGAETADAGQVEAFADDFYTRELEEFEVPTGSRAPDDLWARHERPQASVSVARDAPNQPAAPGLDFLIHGDPLIEPEAPKRLIQPGTTVEPGASEPSRRSEGRADIARHRVMPAGVVGVGPADPVDLVRPPRNEAGAPLPAIPARPESASEPNALRLQDYLEGDLIASPSQMLLGDAPVLTLDPKQRVFHADADLAALAPYAEQALPRSVLRGVSSIELNRVRDVQPGRSYDELKWLMALLRGGGRLASRLDPGGSFQVASALRIDPTFHAHAAIAKALATPARLHEIAASSGATMEQVFDVVSAYDAIGRLVWTPRQRLASAPDSRSEPSKPRFWPFGKR
jgi:hypothetical protein